MSDTGRQTSAGASARVSQQIREADEAGEEPTGSWVAFGSLMLLLLGSFQAIAGIVALFEKSYYAAASEDLVVDVGYTAWGWIHLAIGALAVAAGIGLWSAATWARVAGVAISLLSAIVNLGFLAAYPIWAVMMIVLDVLVIYAITAHGRDMAV